MKISKNLMILATFLMMFLIGSTIYAGDDAFAEANVKVETSVKDGEEIENLVSEDNYVRIYMRISELKKNNNTFESKMNLMIGAKQGTLIVIEVYNTKAEKLPASKNVVTYTLNPIGITETVNQLIELEEGQNKVVVIYTNEKDKKNNEKMIFFITRELEEKKERIKDPMMLYNTDGTLKTNLLK